MGFFSDVADDLTKSTVGGFELGPVGSVLGALGEPGGVATSALGQVGGLLGFPSTQKAKQAQDNAINDQTAADAKNQANAEVAAQQNQLALLQRRGIASTIMVPGFGLMNR